MPDQRLLFSKTGRARFISHLDLMRTFQRAFLRAGVAIKHTEGFNPHAFVSIALPLSVGYASQCEILEFGLLGDTPAQQVPGLLNAALPEGIEVQRCYDGLRPIKALAWVDYSIVMEYEQPVAREAAQALEGMLSQSSLVMQKRSKKAKSGFTEVDIIPLIRSHSLTADDSILTLRLVSRAQNPGLNPGLLVEALGGLDPTLAPVYLSFLRNAVLDEDGNLFE